MSLVPVYKCDCWQFSSGLFEFGVLLSRLFSHPFVPRSPRPDEKQRPLWASLSSNPKASSWKTIVCFIYLQCIPSYLLSRFHSFSPQRSDLLAERVILKILLMVAVFLWPRDVVMWPLQISLAFFPSELIFSKILQTRSSNQSQVVKSSSSSPPSFPLVCTGQVCWHHKTLFPFSSFPYFFSLFKIF